MAFRNFRYNCTMRGVVLVITALGFALLLTTGRYASGTVVGVLIAYQVWSLIRYVEFTNRSLELFLRSIEFSDFSHKLAPGPAGTSFENLAATFDGVLRKFREISSAREENLRYLHSVVQHVGVGLIAFDQQGKVELLNAAAKSLLDVPVLRYIDDLARSKPEVHRKLRGLQAGRHDLVTVGLGGRPQQLSLHTTELKRRRQILTIVSIQNISSELNEKEMEAWRNLVRVLAHEIKNSLTPIASLAASVEELIAHGKPKTANGSFLGASQIGEALQTIQRRSEGLLKFVNAYRDLTHIPEPECEVVKASELFARVKKLIAPQIENKPVSLRTAVRPETMTLTVDPRLIEQVLINLLLNSLQVTERQAEVEITLEASVDTLSRPVVRVTDNGPGILADSLEKVFVPFYSTRKEGSGIGLSLSRQIMRMHRGELTVHSEPGVRTTFTMQF